VTSTPDQPEPAPPRQPRGGWADLPRPLAVAALLALVEALTFGILAVVEVVASSSATAVMGATTALFFTVYGLALAACGLALLRLKSWARAPVVVAQLIQLLVGWDFRGGDTTWVTWVLALVAGAVLVGIFHPRSIEALADR
jgi:hypothetical protein